MDSCVVVGGGLCGLFSSIILADKFDSVTVIETANECGGLLKSIKDEAGIVYDQGTHIPNTTLIPEIDDILFGPENDRATNWNTLGRLKTGNYFQGDWDLTTQIVDSRKLPKDVYEKGLVELLSLTEPSEAADILTYLTQTIGKTFAEEIAIPVCKKLYGEDVELEQLMTKSSVNYFGLSRVLALTPEITEKLKELPVFDQKLGYHTIESFEKRVAKDKINETVLYYPKHKNGVQYWVDHLVNTAKSKGVKFVFNDSVKKIEYSDKNITSITLSKSNEKLDCQFLYWSAPPFFALQASGLPIAKAKASFRTANIYHFTFDQPLLNNNSHYLWNWDSSFKSFRVTLFPNLRLDDKSNSTFNLSIEALTGVEDSDSLNRDLMLTELCRMGIISKSFKVLSEHKQVIHNTFPVPTFEFTQSSQKNCEQLSSHFNNIMISGRFSGKQWFHADIIKAAYAEINERFPINKSTQS